MPSVYFYGSKFNNYATYLMPESDLVILFAVAALITLFEAAVITFDKEQYEEREDSPELKIKKITRLQENPTELFAFTEYWRLLLLLSATVLTIVDFIRAGYSDGPFTWLQVLHAFGLLILFLTGWQLLVLMLPKGFGKRFSGPVSLVLITPMYLLIRATNAPLKILLDFANLLLKPFKTSTTLSQGKASEEEIRSLLNESVKTGEIDKTEHEIIQNVFELNDVSANEVMIPRTEMIAVELTDDEAEIFNFIVKTGHSLLPVYKDSTDNIMGILHIKDLMRNFIEKGKYEIRSLIRPAYFVPETKRVSEILKEMQMRGERIAIVTDEWGGTEGVITLEDILSEIVGKITGDTPPQPVEFSQLPDGKYNILGSMHIETFNETFNHDLPESDEYNTVAGFISYKTGKILGLNEQYTYESLTFELVKKLRQKMVQFNVWSAENDLREKLPDEENRQ